MFIVYYFACSLILPIILFDLGYFHFLSKFTSQTMQSGNNDRLTLRFANPFSELLERKRQRHLPIRRLHILWVRRFEE